MTNHLSRRDTHSGSWYEDAPDVLESQLTNWLHKSGPSVHGPARVLIVPHAGYTYSGACAAHAYKEIEPSQIKRIFILGPSHHVSLDGCALTITENYETPLGNLKIDKQTNRELQATSLFAEMSLKTDEDEHSIEMQLPYIAKVMKGHNFQIVPILIGYMSKTRECQYGEILSKYLTNEENLFVISSDFCHWGARFDYQYYDREWGAIHESIERLDKMAMNLIENLDVDAFKSYLKKYHNTICGRKPIELILQTIRQTIADNKNLKFTLKFLNYAQSSKCRSQADSSVSYAAASMIAIRE